MEEDDDTSSYYQDPNELEGVTVSASQDDDDGPPPTSEQHALYQDLIRSASKATEAPEISGYLKKMQDAANAQKAALIATREHLVRRRYNDAMPWLAFSAGMGAPTKSGSFFESLSNANQQLIPQLQKRQEWQEQQETDADKFATQIAGLGGADGDAIDPRILSARLRLAEMSTNLGRSALAADSKGQRSTVTLTEIQKLRAAINDPNTPEEDKAAYRDRIKKLNNIPVNASTQAAAALTGDSLDDQAEYFRQTHQLPAGAGRSPAMAARIMNRAAELARAKGQDNEAVAIMQQSAQATRGAVAAVQRQKGLLGSAERTAGMNLDLAVQAGTKVDRTGSPMINKVIQHFRTGVTSDPETRVFVNSLITARNEYARVVSGATGATGITDSARSEAKELFDTIDSQETLRKVVAYAKKEMRNRMSGFDQQLNELRGNMAGDLGSSDHSNAPTSSAPAAAKPKRSSAASSYLRAQGVK